MSHPTKDEIALAAKHVSEWLKLGSTDTFAAKDLEGLRALPLPGELFAKETEIEAEGRKAIDVLLNQYPIQSRIEKTRKLIERLKALDEDLPSSDHMLDLALSSYNLIKERKDSNLDPSERIKMSMWRINHYDRSMTNYHSLEQSEHVLKNTICDLSSLSNDQLKAAGKAHKLHSNKNNWWKTQLEYIDREDLYLATDTDTLFVDDTEKDEDESNQADGSDSADNVTGPDAQTEKKENNDLG